jgi:hypothetical protein
MSSLSTGRVNVLDGNNYDMYKLFDDNKKQNNFHKEAIHGIHSRNKLADVFFSQENINILQDSIRYLVYQKSCGKYTIDRQSDSELKLIMRAYYLQEGRHSQYDTVSDVRELNSLVLGYAVPKILQEINMYMYYKQDIGRNPMPMGRGEFSSSKGTKQLELKNF